MKALTWLGPKQMELRDTPKPSPGPGEVLVEVAAVGICGSELEGYLGESAIRTPPQIFGHEFVGTVVEVGADAGELAPGTRVVINPLLTCGTCELCLRGQSNICLSREIVGAQRPGGMADFVVAPATNAVPISDALSDVEASLVEPLAVSIRAVELADAGYLDRAVVIGAGNIGLLVLQVLATAGVGEILTVDTHPDRRATAAGLGSSHVGDPLAATPGELLAPLGDFGADVVFDCVGKDATRKLAQALIRTGGRIVLVGLHDTMSALDFNAVVRNEIAITGSYTYSDANFRTAIRALERGVVDTGEWTEVRPLAAGAQSFDDLIDHPTVVSKYVLTP